MRSQTPTPRSVRFVSTFAVLAALLAALVFSSSALAQSPPGSVSAVSLSRADGTVTADWPAVAGAARYHVTYSTDGGASWHAPVDDHWNVPTNGLTFGADNAKTYVVGVRAGNDDGWGGWTNSSSAGPYTTPAISATLTIADAKADEGDALSFTVTLDNAVPGGFTVTPSFTDGTATGGTDYTATASALTFTGTAGETQTVTVQTTEDTDTEDDETFTVGLSVSNTAHDVTASDTATGTIANDDSDPFLGLDSPSVQEGDSGTTTLTFTARLTDANGRTQTSSKTISASYEVLSESGDTATAGQDYTAASGTLTFAPGETSKTIDVSIMGDTEVEGDETLTVKWTNWGNVWLASYTHTGTITNDDSAAVTINDAKADEGDGITFTVTLGEAVQGGLKVTPGYTNGTAASTDYTTNTTALTFTGTKGETKTFTVSTTDDAMLEANETFTVGLSVSGTTHDVTASGTGTGTITNDDSAAVTVNDAKADEGNGITFTVTLGEAVQGGLKVTPGYTNGTAASTDYTANTTALTFTGNANETKSFTVSTTEDAVLEGDETFTVDLSVSGTSLSITATDTGAGTITNDDSAAVTVNDAKADEGDDITFTVTLSEAVQGGLKVTPSFTDGTAVEGTDYDDNTTALSFSGTKGETKTFTVSTTEDEDVEGDETFTVGLTVSGTTHDVTDSDTATGTITNDDSAAASITLSVNPSSVSEDAGSTSVTVTATADAAVAANTPVTVSIGGGTATSGTDYTAAASLELEIPAGGTTGTGAFKLTPIYDSEIEGKETIPVSGSASGLSVTGTSLELTDSKDVSAEWWFGARLSVSPGSVSENGGKRKVTVTAEVSEWGTSTNDLSYEVTVGKGGDSAVSGTDYKAVSKFNVVIKANRRSGSNSFNLEPIGDTDWEGNETITIHASGTDGAQSTTLTLTDEGDRPYNGPPITLSANPSKVSEADGATTVTVTATLPSAAVANSQATVSVGGGTATPGTDYAAVSDVTITIAKNATTATGTFTLTPTQDTLAEGDETITIAGPAGVSTPATLTLTDDDAAPAVTLSASPSSVTENGGAKTVTVTATSAAATAKARTVLVAVGNRQDTATPGTDYTVVPAFNITIAANATTATGTFSLTPTNDTSVEDAESISIDGTPESAGATFTVGGTAITLTDDDAMPAVTLTATPSSVDEAALATSVTVKATAASAVAWARTLTVSVGKTGSAASGTDYAAVSNFDITIAANALSGTGAFTLKPIQDTTNEGDETIGVAGSSLNTTVTGATVTLADDDVNPAVTLSVSPVSVGESASATSVTVTATTASAMSSARTVSVKVGDSGTATSGTDYAAVSDFTITIAANATSGTGTFTLTPTQDTQSEGGETIGVSGSSTATTVTGTTVALTDDDTLPAVTLSVSTSSVSEGASATSVTVTATAASSVGEARTVTVSVGQTGTASPGSDYAAVTDFDITIAANATSGTGTFTLTPTQDTVVEYNETIGVDGSSPNTVMTNATITLTDDDKDSVTLSLNRRTLGEEASGTSVTVTATAATAIAVARTVTVSVGGSGTATSGTDYTAVSDFTITIAANATSGTGSFTLTPTQDTTNEGNETIGVAGTNSLSTVTGTTLTLVDDDQPTISLTSGTAAFSESWSGTIDITATRTGSTTSAVDVTIIVGRDTDSATEGVDYTEVADYTITIPAGQTSASKGFSVAGKRDFVADNNERFSIGGLATGYKVNDVSNGVGIFEWYATIGLTTDVSSVSEHDGATTVTVTAHIHPTVYGNVYVTVSVGGGTATSGTDYAAVSNFTITIPNKASSATGTFTLTPTPDALLESDETININGSGSHFNFYAGQGTSMTLTDAQPISLSAHPSRVSEGAPGTQVAVSATATGTLPTPRTVTVSVGDTGTATSGTDYAAVSDFDIVIPANKRGATNTFTLTPTKDSAAEGDETIGVAGSSTGAYVYPTTLTLADTNPAVTLTAAPSTISEGASATSVTVTATAASAIATARTVTVAVGDSGTATSGTDYAAVSDFTITIAANATSGTGSFTLTPTDDTALEGDETIGVAGTSSEAATISGTSLTLTDDDLPTITLATVPPDVKIAEGAGLTSVTVRATAAAAMKAETTVTLSVGAGGDSATKTTDYTTSNVRTITIPKGQSMAEASFELTPKQDTSVEGDETVSISGSSSGGHTVTGTSLTLTDDDKHVIALSASPSSVGEGASATSVTVTATAKAATSSARTVRVQVGDSGTATSGTDYAAVSDFTITIAANAKTGTGTFTLTPTQDTSVEGNETIGVEGASPNSTVTGTTMTLTDDDSYPAITLSANPSSVSEGASATSVTVTATAASAIASARTVTVSVGGSGTASRGIDYATVADFTVTIAANATSGTGTFTLTPSQDTLVEGSETIGVAGSSPSSTVTGTTVTLTDDDTHAITLSASPSSVSESKASETVTVTATINVARSAATAVTVSVGESGDQATSGTDYEAVSDFTVTIAANATSGTGTFTFKPKTDTAYEGFENVTISGTTAQLRDKDEDQNQDVVGTQSETGVSTSIPVTDTSLSIHDSSNYPAVTLAAAPSSVGEGAGATSVTVTATAASAIGSSREVTVSVGGSGTATSGTDYTAVSDFIIKIAANATSGTGTFTLTPTDDSVVEASETIGVAGTSLSTTVTGTTVTLTDNDSAEVTINDASAAEGSRMTFTVTLDTAVDGGLTVTPDFTDVTATEGTDYDENTAGLSFTGTAGETQTFTVSTTQDDVVEGNETFTVGLSVSNAPTGVTVTATDTGTGTIESGSGGNVDTATLTINDASASEGDGITFTVTLSEAVQGGLTVTPDFTDVTATEGTDYDENTTALTFTGTKGETQTFTVDATEDAVLEANETFTVGMTVSGTTLGSSITSTDTGTGTINDDDSAAVTIADANADEGDGITFTVTLSEAVQGGLTVTPSFTDVSAVEGTDYDENTTALTFTGTKGETKTFTVDTTEDTVVEANETFTVSLTASDAPTGTTVTATDTGTGTINNDDGAVVTVNDANADEGDGITFTVTLGAAVQGGLTVTPSFTDVSAVEGTDYDENTTALSFTGTKGETKTFIVSTTEDAVLEADETFTVGLSVSNSGVTSTDTGTGTINNDDSAAVTINDANADEGDGITFTVTLGAAVQGGLTVTPDFTDVTAVEGTDYDENTTALTFTGTKGETKTFTVDTTEDTVVEANETFTVSLAVSDAPTGTTVTVTDTGTGTINNDDSAAVTIADANADEGDGITFTVTLSEAVQGGLTVTPSFTDVSAVEGTDYDENTTALSFTGTKGETKTFTVDTTEDTVVEANETFTVSLTASDAPTGTTVTVTDTGTGTINNDDGAVVTVNDANADEGDGITFTVTLGAAVQGGLTVTPSFTDVSAVEGTDYDENTTALSFTGTKGETKTFIVSTTEDAVLEADETFTVGLSVSNSGVTSTDTGTGTINNDDSAAVTINDANADEGDGITFTVTLSEAVQGGLTVTPSFTDVSAVEGTDYDENTTALTFAGTKGETKTFTVDTTEDTVVEANETFTVSLAVSDAPTGTTVTATDTGTGTINNDDGAVVTVNDANADEGDGITFTVTLGAAVQGGLTVTPSFTDVSAVEGTDYDENTTALSFTGTKGETKTFIVSTTEDAVLEADETFTVGLSVSNSGVTSTDTGTGTINNDDSAAVTINDANADEGDGITFTVTLSEAVQGGLTVTPDFTDVTAVEGTDYDENTTALTFAGTANETQTFTVDTTEDTVVEANETFTVSLAVSDAPTGTTVTATDTGTGTINNDDSAEVTVNDASAAEGSDITFTVTLDAAVQGGLTVTPDFTDVTAVEGTDYDENTTALSFTGTANETKTFTVSTTQDTVVESNETFTVGLTVSGAPKGVTATDTGTGTINSANESKADTATLTIDDASASEGNSMTFTVTLSEAVQGGLTVTPSYTNGTAASGDYTANTTALSFTGTKGETKTFTVSTTEDAVLEGNETFTVGLTVSGTTLSDSITSTDTGTGTINNDDSAAVTVNDANADEGNGMTFTVTLAQAVQGGLTVTPSYTNGTAASGDYTANTTALSFSGTANETKTFTVSTTEDAVLEANETFTVGLSVSGTSLSLTVSDTGTGTINDDDSAAVTVNDAEADEGDGITFTVTLGAAVQGGLKVTPSYTNGTAASGDYTANTTALSFTGTKGETKTFTVSTTEDAVLESNETFTVGLAVSDAPTGTTVTATDTGTGTIDNDDGATVTVNDAEADEGDGITFTVTLGAAVQGGLKVTPGYTNGTAASTDYTANTTALTFTGTANETKTFTVSTTEDAVLEADETFTVGLSVSGTSLTITATDTGTGTINNDDSAAVTIDDANADEGNGMTFTVTLGAAVQGGLTVTPGYTNGTAASTDYTANTTALTFNGTKGETKTFTVQTTEDAVLESDETFTVDLTVSGTSLDVTDDDTATGTITDDDGAKVTIADANAGEGDSMTFTVTLGAAVQGGLTVTPSFTDVTAVEGTDYDENTTALSFTGTANETKTFTVSTTEDDVLEANETFTVGLTVSGTTLDVTDDDTGTGTINNDDSATVTVNDADADEGDSMTFTVTLDKAVQGGLTVTPGFTDDTATEGTDYTKNTTALRFTGTANETKTFTVSTTQDTILEADETFTVGLSVSKAPAGVTYTDTGTGTVNNDDGAGVIVNDANAAEGQSMTFTVTLTDAVQGGLTVTPGFTNGTASGTDYAENTAPLNFSGTANETKSFTVSTTEDTVVEGDETFTVGLTVSGTSLSVDATDTGTGTINDNDGAVVTVNNAEASEGDDMTFTVTLGEAVQDGLTVTPSFTDVTAVEGTDYDENTTALSFSGTKGETKTFTVSTTEDAVLEANETFTVGLSVSNSSVTATDTGTGTINNDDSAVVTVNNADADEGDAMTFTVTLDTAVQGGLTVTPSFTDVTAVEGTDYDENATALSFTGTANETQTFTVSTTQDSVVEGNETFTVGLTVSGTTLTGNITSTDTSTGTINDDDNAPSVDLSVNTETVAEDAGATPVTVTATFSAAVTYPTDTPVTVSVGDSADSAVSGTDYAAVTDFTVTIAAGQTSGSASFTLTPTDDTLVEGDETITVSGTATGLTVNGTSLTLTDDDGDPVINLSVNPATVAEDAGATAVTVTATFSNAVTYTTDTPVTVSVGDSADSAVSGTDYAAVTDFTVTIPAGASSGTGIFTLTPTDDTLVEGNETITVSGTATGLTVNGTSLTLTDDDGDPVINLSVNPATVAEDAGATAVTVTATFSNAVTYTTDTPVTVSVGDSADSAVSGTDYAAVTDFTVTIPAGASSGTGIFTLTPTDDTLVEGNETITVSGTATGLTVNGTSLTLTDDDGDPGINLSVNPATVAEDAGATAVTVTATFSNAVTYTTDTPVTVSVGDSADSAVSGTDYAAVTDFTVTIPAGASSGSGTFTLTPTHDTLVEGNETISVDGAATGLTVNGTSLTLTDNDSVTAANLVVNLSVNPATVAEDAGATAVTVTATFSNAVTYTTDTPVTVSVGDSADSATSGTDYADVADFTVTIPAGASSGTGIFTLTPTDDTLVEGNETITVSGTATGLTVNGTSLTLTDDDGDPVINLSVNPATVAEDAGATAVTVTATFSNAVTYTTDTPVTVSVGDSADSAVSGTDYAAVTDFTVTIPAGASSGSGTFTLTPTHDTLVEGNETISVDGAATGLTVNGTSLTLTDDDGDPVINLSVNPATVAEDAGATAVTVTAAFSPATTYDTDTPVTVSVGDSTDSATSGTDYAAVANFTVTIAAGQTSGSASFTLTPTDDTLVEGNETITVSGTATGLTVNGTSLTLTDDDGDPVINLSVNPATVAEDAGATAVTVTAAFSNAVTYTTDTPVTVSVGDSADSATSGTDYAAVANFTVTIAAGQTSGSASFTLTPTDDTLVEGDETISVDGAATGLTVNGTSLALSDDDDFATVTVSNARALEGETMTFTLTLDKTAPGNFTVTPVYSDGTATAKVDYTPNTSSVAFAGQAGEQHTFTVATLADDLVEPDETFGVSLGIVGPSGIRGRSGSGTIDSNDVVTVVAAIPQGDDVREAGGPRVMTARVWANGLTFSTDMAFTVQVGNGSGTAQEGVDYETVPDFDVVIPAGATSAAQDFTVTPIDDRIVEGDETIVLDGTLPGYDVAPSTLTILDDDAPDFSLAVTPARVRESDGPTPVTVTVETGGVTFPADVNVAVEVTDGTAIAGEDYARVAAFDLLIAAGETSGTGTFTLIPTADGVKEDDEDVRVAGVVRGRTVGDLPDGYDLAPESVVLADDTVVPNRLDAVNREVLPHVARAMLASNIAALTECGVSGTAPGSSLASLLGTHGQALETGDLSLQQALGDADFRVPLRASQEEEASARFKLNALWGCGDYRMLSDRSDDALDWEGNLFSLHLGVDAQVLPNLVTGLALSRSQARFDYRDLSAAGQHRTDVTSVSPYARWTLAQGMSLWAMAGLGWGSVEIDDDALAAGSSDAGLTLAALGLDNALLTRLHGSGETSLRLKAEGSLGRLSVDGSDTLGALAVQVQRLRLALEGSRTWQMQSGGAWTTALEVGLRHDGGDGATGSGVEVGGGVNYHDARLGLTLALSGRTLVAHGADYDEWGVGGMIRFDPGRQGVGLSASLQPVLGQAQSGVAQLWEQTLVDPSSALGGEAARVEAELGYGLVALGGRGLVRPYTQVSMAGEGSRHYRMGSRLELGDTLRVGVEVGRREASGSETDHGVMLRLELGSAGGGVAVGSGLHGGGLPNAGPVDGRLGRFSSRAWDAGRE